MLHIFLRLFAWETRGKENEVKLHNCSQNANNKSFTFCPLIGDAAIRNSIVILHSGPVTFVLRAHLFSSQTNWLHQQLVQIAFVPFWDTFVMGYLKLNLDNGLAILVIKSNGNNQLFLFLFLFYIYICWSCCGNHWKSSTARVMVNVAKVCAETDLLSVRVASCNW